MTSFVTRDIKIRQNDDDDFSLCWPQYVKRLNKVYDTTQFELSSPYFYRW